MADSANADDRLDPTPVPPRGGKRKPNRPVAKSAAGGKGRPSGAGASSKGRPADNRRVARAQQRKRKQTLLAAGGIVAVIALVAVFIGIRSSTKAKASDTALAPVSASTLTAFTSSVSLQSMKAAAANYSLTANDGQYGGYPQLASDTAITRTGKPELLYIGAEYCPFCATERWPLVLALSKFGTFRGLSAIHSATTMPSGTPEAFPHTATFSFYKSTYTSPYLTFTPVEQEGIDYKTLQRTTAAQQAIVSRYDTGNSIPFVYFNGKAVISGAEYDAGLLAGKTFQQVADEISGGTSKLASSVTANAGAIVSDICRMTGGKPGNVCSLFPKPVTS